jgi:hypothetical protein
VGERQEIVGPLLKALPHRAICSKPYFRLFDVRLGPGAGKADLVLVSSRPELIVIECKKHGQTSLARQVIAQALLYHAAAIDSPTDYLWEQFERAAERQARNGKVTLNELGLRQKQPLSAVRTWLTEAKKATSAALPAVRTIIATDEWRPDVDDARVGRIVRMLKNQGLPVSVVTCASRRGPRIVA